jgi:hypothetical protein
VCNFLFLAHLKRAHVRHVTFNEVPLMLCVISLYIGIGSHCNRIVHNSFWLIKIQKTHSVLFRSVCGTNLHLEVWSISLSSRVRSILDFVT